METFDLVIYLLPIVFMLHEFEELVFLKPWLERNKTWIGGKFPRFEKALAGTANLSPSAFALIVAEEFILVSLATVAALVFHIYYPWLAVLLAFSLHAAVHLAQGLALRRYVPVIATSVLSLAYGIWSMLIVSEVFSTREILLCLLLGTIFMGGNLWAMHRVAAAFGRPRK